MKVSFKISLPLLMGLVSALLMVWDIHNQRVIEAMGMAWDTGAPFWPYQAPDTLLFTLNMPAAILSNFTANAFGWFGPWHYLVFLLVTMAWWWMVGLYVDRRPLRKGLPKTPVKAILLCLLAAGLAFLGVEALSWPLNWWRSYSRTLLSARDILLLKLLTPALWCFALGSVAALAAWRRMRGVARPPDQG